MSAVVGETEEYEPCPYHGGLTLEHGSRAVYASCDGSAVGCTWRDTFYASTRDVMVAKAERAWRRHVVAWFGETRFVQPFEVSTVEGWLDEVLGSEISED